MPRKKSQAVGRSTDAGMANHVLSMACEPQSRAADPTAPANLAREAMSVARELQSPMSGLFKCAPSDAENAVPDIGETIDRIRYWHRQRCFAMEQRKRIDLSLGSFLRMMLGWSLALPDPDRKRIASEAAEIVDNASHPEWATIVAASAAVRKPFDDIEAVALKEMSALAKQLPAWQTFGVDVRGFGVASLAVIVGEAGDLANYSSVAKLWKRMGLAVINGVRQGAPGKGASADEWIAHGYSPVRRSRMWNIGDALIKGNRDGAYRTAYLARKEYEIARDPEMRPIVAHRRAQRYMEKRLLKHLWQAWRRTTVPASVMTRDAMSASEIRRAA